MHMFFAEEEQRDKHLQEMRAEARQRGTFGRRGSVLGELYIVEGEGSQGDFPISPNTPAAWSRASLR